MEVQKPKITGDEVLSALQNNLSVILPALAMVRGRSPKVLFISLLPVILPLIFRFLTYLQEKKKLLEYPFSHSLPVSASFENDYEVRFFRKFLSGLFNHGVCRSATTNNVIIKGVHVRRPKFLPGKNTLIRTFTREDFKDLPKYFENDVRTVIGRNFRFSVEEKILKVEAGDEDSIKSLFMIIENWELACTELMGAFYSTDGINQRNIDPTVRRNFEHIFLSEENQIIRKLIEGWVDEEDEYRRLQIPHKIGFLFHGPFGNGKSSLGEAIANHFGLNFHRINIAKMDENMIDKEFQIEHSVVMVDEVDRVIDSYLTNPQVVTSEDKKTKIQVEAL